MKIKIENLSFAYSSRVIFHGLNLDTNVHDLAIMGPSGGGKSTLLRILAGLETAYEGSITIDDKPLPKNEKELRQYRMSIAVVFQAYNLFPHLNVLENILLPLKVVHKLPHQEAVDRSQNLLKSFQLENEIDKKIKNISGGQKQRVSLIRALALNPRILFMDEPTSALDPFMSHEVVDTLLQMKKTYSFPVAVVTHNVSLAQSFCSHILYVSQASTHFIEMTDKLRAKTEKDFFSDLTNQS